MWQRFQWIKSPISERLTKRYLLSDIPDIENPFLFQRLVVPVTIADEVQKTPEIDSHTDDISAAAGGRVTYFTVPSGKRWRLYAFRVQGTTANTAVYISDGTNEQPLTTQDTTERVDATLPSIPLNEDWTIRLRTTGNGADSAISLSILYEEEESFIVR